MKFVRKIFSKEIVTALFGLTLILLQSCRDDAIDPENSYGNINEPVVLSSFNSFEFQINASNISQHVNEPLDFIGIENFISISVKNYSKGSVSIRVKNKSNTSILFSVDLDKFSVDTARAVGGDIPGSILVSFDNFSGFFKLELYSFQPYLNN